MEVMGTKVEQDPRLAVVRITEKDEWAKEWFISQSQEVAYIYEVTLEKASNELEKVRNKDGQVRGKATTKKNAGY